MLKPLTVYLKPGDLALIAAHNHGPDSELEEFAAALLDDGLNALKDEQEARERGPLCLVDSSARDVER